MQRFAIRSTQIAIDLAVLAAAFGIAFLVRFDGNPPLQMTKRLLFLWPYVVTLQYLTLVAFRIPKFVWRYVGMREAGKILQAMAVSSALLLAARLAAGLLEPRWGYAQYALVPIGVILFNFALAYLGIAGVRGLRRVVAERRLTGSHSLPTRALVPTLLVGAGEAGVLVAKEIGRRPDLGIQPLGFVDDDPVKRGTVIQGIPVMGTVSDLQALAESQGAKQVVITMASAPGETIRRVVEVCEKADLPVRIIPGIYEILDGKVNLSRIRNVSIEDVLGRPPVTLDVPLIESFLKGKRVLVTGAGGSIGSELCRQIARFRPASLSLVERAEFHLFTIHHELVHRFPDLKAAPRICDVCDSKRLDAVFELDQPEVVFHAAAHKHVPMMEWNPGEALKNNVFGTQKVADAAARHGTASFVLISTDKAVNPTSIMGATKRIAEMIVQALARTTKTKYVAVRFGNVLGSAGSVIPVFQKQIETGGPVTVTHPEMKRYFMTIPEASQLVMQAAAMGNGGEIFVLDMGTPVKIVDLARDLIRLSGFEPDTEIGIEFTGVRPGEKLFEELGFDAERMDKTRHPKIFIGRLAPASEQEVRAHLDQLAGLTSSTSSDEIRRGLQAVVPEMQADATSDPPRVSMSDGAKSRIPVTAAPTS